MTWKKLCKALLFPHIAALILLLPASAALLIYSMSALEEAAPLCIISYVLSFYTLAIWCVRIPEFYRFFKNIKHENRYVQSWTGDPRLRTNVTVAFSAAWNGAYAALQLGLGIYHSSAWFYALAAYYASLAIMRYFLVRHTLRHKPGALISEEFRHYRACGWVFLFINLALSAMIFFMIHENRVMRHHEITTIALAAYTFTTLSYAIVNVIKYRKYNSPVLSAARATSLAAACVSMLTLENTMLSTFGAAELTASTRRLFLSLSGGAASVFIIVMAIYMIVQASRKIRNLES